jgi:hypothetical protein
MQDIFDSKDFKELPLSKRIWIRLKIAFFETITMI